MRFPVTFRRFISSATALLIGLTAMVASPVGDPPASAVPLFRPGALRVSDSTVTEGGNGSLTTATVPFSANGASVSCDYRRTITHVTTSTEDFRFTFSSPTFHLSAGLQTGLLNAGPIGGDNVFEPDEVYDVTYTGDNVNGTPCHFVGSTIPSVTIINDEPIPLVARKVRNFTKFEGSNGVGLAGFATNAPSNFSTDCDARRTVVHGTTDPSDFVASLQMVATVHLQAQSSQLGGEPIVVNGIVGDLTIEPDETFRVIVEGDPVNGKPCVFTNSVVTGTILDDDAPVGFTIRQTFNPPTMPNPDGGFHYLVACRRGTVALFAAEFVVSGHGGELQITAGGGNPLRRDDVCDVSPSFPAGFGATPASATVTVGRPDSTFVSVVRSALPHQMLYETTVVPPELINVGPATPATTAQRVFIACNGFVHGIWWFRTAPETGNSTVVLWRGTNVAAVATGNPTGAGWVFLPFPAPLAVSANEFIFVGVHHPTGAFAQRTNGFTNRNVTNNACLDAPASALPNEPNGRFQLNPPSPTAFPVTIFQDSEYFISPDLTLG